MPIHLTTPIPREPGQTVSVREVHVIFHPTPRIEVVWHLLDAAGAYVTGGSEAVEGNEALAWLKSSGVGAKIKRAMYARIKQAKPEYDGTEDTTL